MSTNPAVDPVQYPTVDLAGVSHPLKLTCASLIRLKNAGIDLFEQPPFDPMNDAHLKAVEAVRTHDAEPMPDSITNDTVERRSAWVEGRAEQREKMIAEVRRCEAAMMPARRDWKGPLDRGTLIDRLETAAKVIAIAISPASKPMDYMELLDQIPMAETMDIFVLISEAIKKATALNGKKTAK